MIKNTEYIRSQGETLAIVREFVDVVKKGSAYQALCPFHKEKTPSFYINTQKNSYVCYGCGANGDGVSFLMDHENMTYPEAIEHVAKSARIEVEYENRKLRPEWIKRTKEETSRRKVLLELAKKVNEWYYSLIWKDNAYNDDELIVFAGRNFKARTLQTFKVFFAPYDNQGKNILLATAEVKEWDKTLLQEISLLAEGKGKRKYDYYRNRDMFPITDHQGAVRGWGGRKPLSDTNKANPKYINSKASEIYNKHELLYGLYQNRRGIMNMKSAVLVEGYTDVMTLHDKGILNAIASCGTALSREQVKLLKRYTDNITILRDGDKAGLKAAQYDVRLFIEENIVPQVVILPENEDPDSFVRKHGKDALLAYVEASSEDGLLWLAMQNFDDDPFKKQKNMKLAGELISYLKSETLQSQYVNKLGTRKYFGSVKREMSSIVAETKEDRLKTKSPLSEKQQVDVINYGIYEMGNRYFSGRNPEIHGMEISNFVLDSKMLIIGSVSSERVVDIRNEHGKNYTLILDSRALTGFNEFKIETERMGNFIFFGDAKDFMRIRRKIYTDTMDVFPLNTMGWNKAGFYVWGNGLSTNGAFTKVDEYGVVEHEDVKYFLPAFSKIGKQYQGDDGEDKYEFEKKFVCHTDMDCIDIKTWSKLMFEVHGWNGSMSVAYICAALFYDIIFSKYQFFPLLNAFGPSGSGKTWLARSVMALFGKGTVQDPFSLASGTSVGFKRKLAQVANSIIWFDEYSNDIEYKRIEALKSAYDGAGHQKGVATQDNRTVTTKIRSALMYIGQQQATKDIALLKRSITLNCKSGTNTLEKQDKSDVLKKHEKTGQLTQITQYLLKYREYMQDEFSQEFDMLKVSINKILSQRESDVEDRIVNNYTIPLAALSVLHKKVDFGFDIKEFIKYCIDSIVSQSESISDEDELSIFWKIVAYLLESGAANRIRHYQDILVEERKQESLQNDNRKDRKDSVMKTFDSMKQLVYIRFTKVHPEYQERHGKQRGKNGLDLGALQYYLKNSPAYIGQKRNKKFGKGKNYSCYVFDLSLLPIELPMSVETLSTELSEDEI